MKGAGQEALEFIHDVSSQIGFLHLCLIRWPGARHHAVCFQSSRHFNPTWHLNLYFICIFTALITFFFSTELVCVYVGVSSSNPFADVHACKCKHSRNSLLWPASESLSCFLKGCPVM